MQQSLLGNGQHCQPLLDTQEAQVFYYPSFISYPAQYMQRLQDELSWQSYTINIFGKSLVSPRLSAWYGDAGIRYSYSGLNLVAKGWQPLLFELKKQLELTTQKRFNAVLANYYRDGQNSMGWHSDDEPELGVQPVIASLSFGGERRFSLKHRYDKTAKPQHITLAAGSLLIMQGNTQRFYQHQIAKTRKTVAPRINLTYRWVNAL